MNEYVISAHKYDSRNPEIRPSRSKLQSVHGTALLNVDKTTYYKIPFWQAVDLVGTRQVKQNHNVQ